jgi:transcriptional regulator with XRE-family HTH domain
VEAGKNRPAAANGRGRARAPKVAEKNGKTSPSTTPETDVGRMIRERRRSKQLTLAQLAELANVSTSYVSQVERGVANPTLASLKTLSHALGITVGSLLDGSGGTESQGGGYGVDGNEVSVLRSGQRRRVVYPGSNIANELLSPNLRMQMEVIWVEAPPGSSSGGHPHRHEGEECGIVISGEMRFWVDEREWLLQERDAIYFPSHLPHRWESAGDEDLLAVWIITPPTF